MLQKTEGFNSFVITTKAIPHITVGVFRTNQGIKVHQLPKGPYRRCSGSGSRTGSKLLARSGERSATEINVLDPDLNPDPKMDPK
jgi:hypothetical protein